MRIDHPIAVHADIDKASHEIWLPADKPLMDGARGAVMCMMETWQDSYGMQYEHREFTADKKPIYYMRWPRDD